MNFTKWLPGVALATLAAVPFNPARATDGDQRPSWNQVAAQKKEPLRVPGSRQQTKLVHIVRPEYPPEAKDAGVSGTVRLRATIDREGNPRQLDVLSGHELLVPPTLTAVKQWRWEPTLLNGEPVEVVTDIDVNFKLPE
jgi:protein TonB